MRNFAAAFLLLMFSLEALAGISVKADALRLGPWDEPGPLNPKAQYKAALAVGNEDCSQTFPQNRCPGKLEIWEARGTGEKLIFSAPLAHLDDYGDGSYHAMFYAEHAAQNLFDFALVEAWVTLGSTRLGESLWLGVHFRDGNSVVLE